MFAYLAGVDVKADKVASAIAVVLQRFAAYHGLAGAFGRRATTERAKGILMERHGIDEETAFGMLRDQARRTGTKLVAIAQSVLEARALLAHARDDAPTARSASEHSETSEPGRHRQAS